MMLNTIKIKAKTKW